MKFLKVTLVRSRAIDPAINKVAKALSQDGHDVNVLVWDRMGNKQTENCNGYTIVRFGFKAPYDKLTVVFYLPIWWIYEFFFLFKQNSDVIHVCDLDTLIPAIIYKLIKKVKLCYIIYDFYANNLPAGHANLIRDIIRGFVASVEKFGIKYTDVLFLVDESRFQEIRGAHIKDIVYIYNSPSDNYYIRQAHETNENNEVIIFYTGLIIKSRGLEYIIRAISDLDGVRLIMGGICHDKYLFDMMDKCKKIQYIGWIPSYDEVIEKTSDADIIFRFSDPNIPKTKYESPNKLFEAMMLRKPIIVSDGSSMANIVKKENCGLVVPYGDVNAIRDAIIKLKFDPELRKKLGENGRKAYDNKYSWKIMESRLIHAYSKITTKNE